MLAASVELDVLKSYGIDLSPEQVTKRYAGTRHSAMFEKVFAEHGIPADVNEAVDRTWKEIFSSEYPADATVRRLSEVPAMLQKMKGRTRSV